MNNSKWILINRIIFEIICFILIVQLYILINYYYVEYNKPDIKQNDAKFGRSNNLFIHFILNPIWICSTIAFICVMKGKILVGKKSNELLDETTNINYMATEIIVE